MDSQHSSLTVTPIKDIIVNVEYIKTLNLNIPHTPGIFLEKLPQPEVIIRVDVNAQQIEKDKPRFEVIVILQCTGASKVETRPEPVTHFEMQLQYGAILTLPTLETANLQEILMVHVPDLLFPEIRNLIINLTRSSNLPPVLLQRIDFAGLWRDKLAAQAEA